MEKGKVEARRGVARKLIASDVILVVQGVPALDLLVLVLQTLVPVLEPLPFSSDPQLTPTCGGGGGGVRSGSLSEELASALAVQQSLTDIVVGLPDVVVPHGDVQGLLG